MTGFDDWDRSMNELENTEIRINRAKKALNNVKNMKITDLIQNGNVTRFGNSETKRRSGLVHKCGMELDRSMIIPDDFRVAGLFCHKCGVFATVEDIREMCDSERCSYM